MDINPYESRTTLTVDRANRLISLRSHPGYHDLLALADEIVRDAEDGLTQYFGWDKDELLARSIAFVSAKKFHEQLFIRMANTIQRGLEEASLMRDANDRSAVEMADDLRVAMLADLERYETRTGGSY